MAPHLAFPQTPLNNLKRSRDGYSRAPTTTEYKTMVGEVELELRQELRRSVFVDTPHFFEKLFDVEPGLIESVYKEVCKGKRPYYKGSNWRGFPTSKAPESNLYSPFVKVANFITKACPKTLDVRWLSDPHRAPALDNVSAADMKPDIISVIGFPMSAQQRRDKAPWRRIHIPMEVKKSTTMSAAALQLFKYLRQIFHESVDRRFAFGIVLAQRNVTVYLADRSGILGSETFDMHKNPRILIRVIAGIATLAPSRLGWDTTLRAFPKPHLGMASSADTSSLSFDVPYKRKPDDHYWQLDMPKPREDNPLEMSDAVETFILYEGLSLRRGEVILGRATRIWKAWARDEMHLPQSSRKVYIVKDTWRDDRRILEGELYARIGPCEGVAKMHSYGIVHIDGEDDTTAALIRCNLKPEGGARQIDAVQPLLTSSEVSLMSPDVERHGVTRYTNVMDFLPVLDDKKATPRGRTHSRLVMKTYGWPIKYAKSLVELVGAMRDAIIGHHNSYDRGVLHRDISIGNIIITGCPEPGRRGVLIDYDNAILLEEYTHLLDDPASGTRPFMSSEILSKRHIFLKYDLFEGRRRWLTIQPKHDVVHDLEAFFWVLVWFCISRDGPAQRHVELFPDNEHQPPNGLQNTFAHLFEADDTTLGKTKEGMFVREGDFDANVLAQFSDYCKPLQTLAEQFFNLLQSAYKNHDYDGLYEKVVSAFDEELAHLPLDVIEKYRDLEKKEEERRQGDSAGHWDVHSPSARLAAANGQEVPPSSSSRYPPEPTSPTPAPKRIKKSPQLIPDREYIA